MNLLTDHNQIGGTNILIGSSDSGKTKAMIAIIYEKLYYKLAHKIFIYCIEDSINYYTEIFLHPILQKKISIIPFATEENCLAEIQKLKDEQLLLKRKHMRRKCVVVFDDIIPYMKTKESENVYIQLASSIRHLYCDVFQLIQYSIYAKTSTRFNSKVAYIFNTNGFTPAINLVKSSYFYGDKSLNQYLMNNFTKPYQFFKVSGSKGYRNTEWFEPVPIYTMKDFLIMFLYH